VPTRACTLWPASAPTRSALPALVLVALLGVLYAAAATAPSASAAGRSPALAVRECFAEVAAGPCRRVPHHALGHAGGIAVSPDGTSVYVAAHRYRPRGPGVDAITEFARDADGTLRPVGCLAFGGAHGCRPSRVPLEGVRHLAVSPDGSYLYATGELGLAEFAREAGGRLRPIGCLVLQGRGRPGTRRCERPAASAPFVPDGIALSPDGADLYLTGVMKEAGFPAPLWVGGLYEFARRGDGTVAPSSLGCFGPVDARACVTLHSLQLGEPLVSPDGSALYAVGNDALWRFRRAADGSLGAPECALALGPGCGLGYPAYRSVALSPDGSFLYLGTIRGTAAYAIGPGGTLTKAAATPIPADALAISPDGSRLYGATYDTGHDGIRAFAVGGGALSPLGGKLPVEGVANMVVTADGGTLLATSSCACDGALLALSPTLSP
jgi:hypothetical protein